MERLVSRLGTALVLAALCAYAAQNHDYVGSRTCFGCHPAIYRSFEKTDMGRSMRLAAELSPEGIPAQATVAVPSSDRVLRVYHDQSGWHQSEGEPNVFTDEHDIEYVVGSGANGLTLMVKRGSYLFQAPLSFYSKPHKWDLSPGYEHVDLGFSRPIAQQCVLCHSGHPRPVENREGEYRDPPFQELAIGCENCHGPGERHIRDPKRPGSIVNPAHLPPRLAEDICMDCHQRGDARILQPGKTYQDFRPGEWLIDTVAVFKIPPVAGDDRQSDLLEHNSAMEASRCFRASRGKLSCLTCHDPHVQPAASEAPAYFRAKCLTCHNDDSCRLPLPTRTKTSPPDNCIGCHMPKRDVAAISHSALTNHRIPARAAEPMTSDDSPRVADLELVNAPPGKAMAIPDITLLHAYADLSATNPTYKDDYLKLLDRLSKTRARDPYVAACLGHKALAEGKSEQALKVLVSALPLQQTTVDEDMADALNKLGRPEEALAHLQAAAARDPYNASLMKTLTLQYINLHRYAEARQQMESYVRTFPEDSFMRSLLARVSR